VSASNVIKNQQHILWLLSSLLLPPM